VSRPESLNVNISKYEEKSVTFLGVEVSVPYILFSSVRIILPAHGLQFNNNKTHLSIVKVESRRSLALKYDSIVWHADI
jgi:hypothetical protein